MHEAEQICDRVAILINGRVIVVGKIEDLRNKYGQGYSISIFFSSSANKQMIEKVVADLKDKVKDQNPEVDSKLAKSEN